MELYVRTICRLGRDIEYPFFAKTPYYDGSIEWIALILLGLVVWFFTRKKRFSPD